MTAKSAAGQSERIQKRFQRMLGAGLVSPANEPGASAEPEAAPDPKAAAEDGGKTRTKKRGGGRYGAFMGSAP